MFRFGHYPKHRRFTANFENFQNIGDFLPKLRHDTNFLDFSKHWRFGVPISEQRSESYSQAVLVFRFRHGVPKAIPR